MNQTVASRQEDELRGVHGVRARLVDAGRACEAVRLRAEVAVLIAGPINWNQ